MDNFGTTIRKLRIKNNFGLEELCDLLDYIISPTYITKIELHGEIPSPGVVLLLADALNYNATRLLNIAKQEKIEAFEKKMGKLYKLTKE